MRNSSSASGSRDFSSRYCCIIGVKAGSLMKQDPPTRTRLTMKTERTQRRTKYDSSLPCVLGVSLVNRDRVCLGSELVEGGLFLGVDLEDLIESGDAEDLEEVGVNAAELELPLDRTDLLL